ncbi:MAG: hypothetical protein AB1457_08070 [Chloroflexota bacterium]|jgi:hypothetical protein
MLTQREADILIKMEKLFSNSKTVLRLGNLRIDESHELKSYDGKEKFHLDIWRGSIQVCKYNLNNRARNIYVLARIDVGGSPHKNPDGIIVPCPHIHIYKEGYDDKWAYPWSDYTNTYDTDIVYVLTDFAKFCNIILPPIQYMGI